MTRCALTIGAHSSVGRSSGVLLGEADAQHERCNPEFEASSAVGL